MKKLIAVLALIIMTVMSERAVYGQFEPGLITVRPEFGLGWAQSVGVSFGGALTYGLSENTAFGPVFTYSTAGRKWKGENLTTKGSNSMIFAGRVYYLFKPESDYPWYVDAGAGIVKFGSITESDAGNKIQIGYEEGEIKGATCFAFNVGTGTVFEVSDNMAMIIDVNSYIGGQGDRKGKTASQDDIDLNESLEGGAFWFLNFTAGLNIRF
jgi:hypothetical protein